MKIDGVVLSTRHSMTRGQNGPELPRACAQLHVRPV